MLLLLLLLLLLPPPPPPPQLLLLLLLLHAAVLKPAIHAATCYVTCCGTCLLRNMLPSVWQNVTRLNVLRNMLQEIGLVLFSCNMLQDIRFR